MSTAEPQTQPIRQRVTWEDASFGPLEILEDVFTLTTKVCPRCRAPLWTSDPAHVHVCVSCQTLLYPDGKAALASGFWLTVVRQLTSSWKARRAS